MHGGFKRQLFKLYAWYVDKVPLKHGKRFLGRRLGRAIYQIGDIAIELDPFGMIDNRLITGEGHDTTVQELLHSTLGQGGIFVDIGANIGYFSLLAAKKSNVSVLAFEPSPRELQRFYRNISLNNLSNITVFPYGLADRKSAMMLNISGEHNPGMNSVLNISKYTVNVAQSLCYFDTFDALIPGSLLSDIRLCKIDVEGFEMSVLEGMRQSMTRMRKATFIVEISPIFTSVTGCNIDAIYDFFSIYGFSPKYGIQKLPQYDEVFSIR